MTLKLLGTICVAAGAALVLTTAAAAQDPDSWCGSKVGDECCMPSNNPAFCLDNLTCVDGVCQDFTQATDIDKMPIMTMEMRVTSCNDSSAILMGGSGPTYSVTIGNSGPFYIDTFNTLFLAGAVDRFGLRVPGVGKLSDIEDVSLVVQNADICVSRVELIINDRVMFDKEYSPFQRLIGTHYPISRDQLVLSGDELRSFWRQMDPARSCAIPDGIDGTDLERTIVAVLGDSLTKAGGSRTDSNPKDPNSGTFTTLKWAEFRGDDFVRTSSSGDSTVHVDARFHASVNVTVKGAPFGADAGITMRIGFDITPSCRDDDPNDGNVDNALSLDVSAISVDEIDGDILTDLVVSLVEPESDIAKALNERLNEVRSSFSNVVRGLQLCPPIVVQGAPASITFPIDPFTLVIAQGLNNGQPLTICR